MRNLSYALIGIAALVALSACDRQHALTPEERATAELGARQYAGTSADLVGVSGSDSDNDGYVTATIRSRSTNENSAIVCSYRGGAVGCKSK